jgi:hypothetical protein
VNLPRIVVVELQGFVSGRVLPLEKVADRLRLLVGDGAANDEVGGLDHRRLGQAHLFEVLFRDPLLLRGLVRLLIGESERQGAQQAHQTPQADHGAVHGFDPRSAGYFTGYFIRL